MTTRRAPGGEFDRRARFEAVAEVVYEPLQRYLRRRIEAEHATELLDDVLMVLWRRLDDVPVDDPLPWSYGVARHCLANRHRGVRRHLRLVARAGDHARLATGGTDRTSGREVAVWEALDTLDDDDREPVRLWAWEQLEPREIAIALGTTSNAVSIRLTRVKQKLRLVLDGKESDAAGHEPGGHGEERGT